MQKRIGIIYCGGCNPRYQREDAFDEIVSILKDTYDIGLAKPNEVYDDLIVIGGCTNCCASYENYSFTGDLYKLRGPSDVQSVIDVLSKNHEK